MLDQMIEIARRHEVANLLTELEELRLDTTVQVAFLGDFSSGKSTLLNELVGIDELMPTEREPCTAAAGTLLAIDGVTEPVFLRAPADGNDPTPIDRATFDDIALGRVSGEPLAHLPPRPGFGAGSVFIDTPGLGGLLEAHAETTFGVLPFVDFAVICVDCQKGGLTKTALSFMSTRALSHLRHRFLIALTQADLVPDEASAKIRRKVVERIARELDLAPEACEKRVVLTSAGPEATERDIEALRRALTELAENRRAILAEERRGRAAQRLAPQLVQALTFARDGLLETDQEFAERRVEVDRRAAALEVERHKQELRLDEFRAGLRSDLLSICERHRPAFAAARDDEEIQSASEALSQAITDAVTARLDRFELDLDGAPGGTVDASLAQLLRNVNAGAGLTKTLATAAATAWLLPGVGAAKTAGEMAAGGAGRVIAEKGARAAAKKAVGKAAWRTVLGSLLKAADEINPINFVTDLAAQKAKAVLIDAPLADTADRVSRHVSRMLEEHFEAEIFGPLAAKLEDLQSELDSLERERREDLAWRQGEASRIDADLKLLVRQTA